ncbi:tyrosine-type recombinase/integrase [Chloroflexota bacterium]
MKTTTTTNTKLYELIDYYQVCNRCANKSPRTISWYTDNLNQFLNYLKSHKLSDSVDDIDIKVLRQYVLYLMKRKKFKGKNGNGSNGNDPGTLAPLSVHGHVRTLRAFFSWLTNEEIIPQNPASQLKPPKVPKTLIAILSDKEISRIMSSFSKSNYLDARNQTIFMLLIDTGIRIGEAMGLTLDDLYLNDGYIKVFGKGQRERIVPIGNNVQKAIHRYLFRYRPEPASSDTNNVFLSMLKRQMSYNAMKLVFNRLAERTGIKRLHAHLCRHTFATKFLTNGGDIFTLQKILGHSTLEMVRRYSNLNSDHVRAQHQKYSPMDRLSA